MSVDKEDFKDLGDSGLREKIVEAKKQLLSLRLRKSSGELKDTSVFGKTRKTIARLFTVLNKRSCGNGSE
ncbi:MAG: 50S ribosomal protein L29 [Rickettsiales bacterium]|jgi:ribosomal protein L29|nr:50S ribosomal protein L29 [Rickettsiales bacterium]